MPGDQKGQLNKLQLRLILWSGAERDVYEHPSDNNFVVKVRREGSHLDRNLVEASYIESAPRRIRKFIPDFLGWVDTQHGAGLAYEAVRDEDCSRSLVLQDAVLAGVIDLDAATRLLRDFLKRAIWSGLLMHDDHPANILLQRRRDGMRLVLVDGFGPAKWDFKGRLRTRVPMLGLKRTLMSRRLILASWQHWMERMRQEGKLTAPAAGRPASGDTGFSQESACPR